MNAFLSFDKLVEAKNLVDIDDIPRFHGRIFCQLFAKFANKIFLDPVYIGQLRYAIAYDAQAPQSS